MELAFYKAEYGDKFDKLVRLWTAGPYPHVEIIFSDGIWFSSSPRDNGCRFKVIGHDSKWDYHTLKLDLNDEKRIRGFVTGQLRRI